MEIWINPACSKCQAATELLDAAGTEYTVRRYLDDPPSAVELAEVLGRLGLEPWDLARLKESVATELGMADWSRTEADRERWIEAMVAHPVLIQRPILTAADGRSAVGRSAEAVRGLLSPG